MSSLQFDNFSVSNHLCNFHPDGDTLEFPEVCLMPLPNFFPQPQGNY